MRCGGVRLAVRVTSVNTTSCDDDAVRHESPADVIRWWETRRLGYNAVVGTVGLWSVATIGPSLDENLRSSVRRYFAMAWPSPLA